MYIPLTEGILKHAMKPAFVEDLGVLEEAQRYRVKLLVILKVHGNYHIKIGQSANFILY